MAASIFSESKASWRKTRQGYEDMCKHFPGSMRILNNYCRLACLAGDKSKAKELFGQIGENKVEGSWKPKTMSLRPRRLGRTLENDRPKNC